MSSYRMQCSLSEADFLSRLGEWSNPGALADELNRSAGADVWKGGYFANGTDAVEAARQGPMGAVLQAPGGNAHMVVVEPLPAGGFLVRDPIPGQSYEVTADWVDRYVAGGVWR